MKEEVFSWRISTRLKLDLEREARARGLSVSSLLEKAALDLLHQHAASADDEEEQRRLHTLSEECFGVLDSGRTDFSESVRTEVRARLKKRYGR